MESSIQLLNLHHWKCSVDVTTDANADIRTVVNRTEICMAGNNREIKKWKKEFLLASDEILQENNIIYPKKIIKYVKIQYVVFCCLSLHSGF